jgi:hypothetical protein
MEEWGNAIFCPNENRISTLRDKKQKFTRYLNYAMNFE